MREDGWRVAVVGLELWKGNSQSTAEHWNKEKRLEAHSPFSNIRAKINKVNVSGQRPFFLFLFQMFWCSFTGEMWSMVGVGRWVSFHALSPVLPNEVCSGGKMWPCTWLMCKSHHTHQSDLWPEVIQCHTTMHLLMCYPAHTFLASIKVKDFLIVLCKYCRYTFAKSSLWAIVKYNMFSTQHCMHYWSLIIKCLLTSSAFHLTVSGN